MQAGSCPFSFVAHFPFLMGLCLLIRPLHVRKMTVAAVQRGREQGEQGGEESCGDGEERVRAEPVKT